MTFKALLSFVSAVVAGVIANYVFKWLNSGF